MKRLHVYTANTDGRISITISDAEAETIIANLRGRDTPAPRSISAGNTDGEFYCWPWHAIEMIGIANVEDHG